MTDKVARGAGAPDGRESILNELERLRRRVYESQEIPDIASEALRKARARTEELRTAYGVATDELARTRALLTEAWRTLKGLEFSAHAYSIDTEIGDEAALLVKTRKRRRAGPSSDPSQPAQRACPACGGLASHSPACPLSHALNLVRDPRPRRRELEDAVDRAWEARTGEREGVKSRLAFLDTVFEELARWGVVRED